MPVTSITDRYDQGPRRSCPDPELLASYIDGLTPAGERAAIESHVATCEDCYFVLTETFEEQRQNPGSAAPAPPAPTPTPRPAWMNWTAAGLAMAATLVLTLRVLHFWGIPQSDIQTAQTAKSTPSTAPVASPSALAPGSPQLETLSAALIALDASTGPFRPFEPRIAGGFQYRPLKPVTRSAVTVDAVPESVNQSARAVTDLAAAYGAAVAARRALAQTYLTTGKYERAVQILEPTASSTADPAALTDLAAAYLVRGGPGDAARARSAAERAVAADPKRAEAWFNLALAAEALDQPARAIEAWTKFLEIDGTSGWAGEARHHLDRLKKRTAR